jgi:endonuclease III
MGTAPATILATPPEALARVTGHGRLAEQQATKLLAAARLVVEQFGGDLARALQGLPLAESRRALRQFPVIGEPGADKILLLSGLLAVPALDSNGVRVLTRLGLADEQPDYAGTYRAATAAVAGGLDSGAFTRAYALLRQHGQELCRRSTPRCSACPLTPVCAYYRRNT